MDIRKTFFNGKGNSLEKQIKEGRQAYIVCPLVEESEESDLKSVVELAKKYCDEDTYKFINGVLASID